MVNHVGDGCGNAHDADFTQALNATAIDQRVRLFHEDDIMSYTSDASISEFADTPAHHAIRTSNTLTNFIGPRIARQVQGVASQTCPMRALVAANDDQAVAELRDRLRRSVCSISWPVSRLAVPGSDRPTILGPVLAPPWLAHRSPRPRPLR